MSKIEKDDVWRTALHKGLQGGTSGAMAMTIQVSDFTEKNNNKFVKLIHSGPEILKKSSPKKTREIK